MPSRLAAYDPQLEIFEGDLARPAAKRAEPLGEMQEMAFAAELMELRDERSLEALVGRVVGQVGQAMGQRRGSPSAGAIRHLLTSLLRRTMPRAAAAGGRAIVPATFGDRLASTPGDRFGLQLEGLSEEDRRFETARQIVRFAADSAKRALAPSRLEPGQAARAAVYAAARRHAPGMTAGRTQAFDRLSGTAPGGRPGSGR